MEKLQSKPDAACVVLDINELKTVTTSTITTKETVRLRIRLIAFAQALKDSDGMIVLHGYHWIISNIEGVFEFESERVK